MIKEYAHITVNTGHIKTQRLEEIEPSVLDILHSIIVEVEKFNPVEMFDGISIRRMPLNYGGNMVRHWQICRDRLDSPIVDMLLDAGSDNPAKSWQIAKFRSHEADALEMPKGAWLSVYFDQENVEKFWDVLDMLGDMERCIAFAYLKMISNK